MHPVTCNEKNIEGESKKIFSLPPVARRMVAFTLAEVLITLGIIGVVAAMTLPTVISKYKQKEAITRLKKFYSAMQQAVMRAQVDYGDPKYWNKESESYKEDGTSDDVANAAKSYDFFMKYIAPYIKYLAIDKKTDSEDDETKDYELKVTMSDGSIMYLHNGSCIDMNIDINGNKNPNKSGYDRFKFILCTNNPEGYCGITYFCSYIPVRASTREKAFALCKTSPAYCSTLLLYDNWEFKDDYPYKI